MNNYTSYKFRKWIEKTIDKFFDFVFYIPRQQYKNNEKFKNWIHRNDSKKSRKRNMKRVMDNIFRDIEQNDNKTCEVLTFTDYENELPNDRNGWDYKILLDSDEWIVKNKLQVERLSFYDYIIKYYPQLEGRFNNFYRWNSHKEEIVLVIKRG